MKKEVSLGTILALAGQSAVIIWFMASLDYRVTDLRERYTEIQARTTSQQVATDNAIAALQSTMNQEIRSMQAQNAETNGRLVRIETLLTQLVDDQRRTSQ